MATIKFKTQPFAIGSWTVVLLPKNESVKLPSRGMTMMNGTINGSSFQIPLEPDGRGSHWFEFNKKMQAATKAKVGDTIELEGEPTKEWTEPEVPADLKKALAGAPSAQALWLEITPMARWDWIRWIRFTKSAETRAKRIDVTLSKLKAGKRRPCCFNRGMSTETAVSNQGLLLEPGKVKVAK